MRATLQDPATITELTVMALFDEAWGKDYMQSIRGQGACEQNMLDMGPLHAAAITHLKNLIKEPSLVLGNNLIPETGRLNGGDCWHKS